MWDVPVKKKEGGGCSSGEKEKGTLALSLDKFNNNEVLKLNIMLNFMLKVCLEI